MVTEACKICHGNKLNIFAHTAQCNDCDVLLYFPYPENTPDVSLNEVNKKQARIEALTWYRDSSFKNHDSFTKLLRFAMDESYYNKQINILDYGGGGGQFAFVCRSHFPNADIYITDINDMRLLDEWRVLNKQILFKDFAEDTTQFDVIFLNDVFEHVKDPAFVLQQLTKKLKDNGKIIIDTPKQFWLYHISKLLAKQIRKKVLTATVSIDHLQIWSKKSFNLIVKKSGLSIKKYQETSEYTQPADYYINRMDLKNPILRIMARFFYKNAKWLAKNKIFCVLTKR